MSVSNENNQSVALIPLGSLSADAELPGLVCPKKMKIKSVKLLNGDAIAASDTDYVELSLLKADDTVVAELDTRDAHEGAVVAHEAKALNLVAAQEDQDANTVLKVKYDETDAGTNVALTDAMLCIAWHCK